MNWLLTWFGTAADRTAVSKVALAFHSQFSTTLLILLGIALVGWTLWSYRQGSDGLQRWQRWTLSVLRALFLLLVLLMLARPVLVLTLESSMRQTLLLLCDTSESMGIHDIGTTSRLEHVQSLFKGPKLNLLAQLERNYDLRPLLFSRTLTDPAGTNQAEWIERLQPTGTATALGDAVRNGLSRSRGRSLAGILLFTDGGNNSGSPPLDAAALARREQVPLYVDGVGNTQPKDVIVSGILAPDLAFLNDEISVAIRVRGLGFSGRTAPVTLSLGDKFITQQSIAFSNDAEQIVTMKFTPKEKGVFDLTASIAPIAGEVVKDNNTRSQRLRVIDSKIKVLLVEESPRWEFRYLLATLLRDRRIDLKCVLFEGDPGIAKGENSPYLEQFPSRKEELFGYDLVILGDVDSKRFKPAQLEQLSAFVSDFGGALVVVAGRRFMPDAYRKTPLEKLLPVELTATGTADTGDKPITIELTADGKTSAMLRLEDNPQDNTIRWRGLPPIYWVCPVGHSKTGAEVLLVTVGENKTPVLATQQYGAGRTLFLGTDNTWRWRKNEGEAVFTTFWSQMVQRMALLRMLGTQKRIQLSSNRQSYNLGDRVTVFARVYSAEYEPVKETTLRAFYRSRGDTVRATEVMLRVTPEQPGMFRGEFPAREAGAFTFYLDRDPQTQLDIDVIEPHLEFTDIAMNAPLLREMAAISNGRFISDAQLPHLSEIIGRKSEHIVSTREIEIWSSSFYLAVLVLLATAEWILRKIWQLK